MARGGIVKRERLTSDRIRRFNCPEGKDQAFLRDTIVFSLSVRATAGGAKSFVFAVKMYRRNVSLTIGSTSTWDIEAARVEARRMQSLVDQGIDPRVERAAIEAAVMEERRKNREVKPPSLNAWVKYIEDRRRHWGSRTLADHENMVKAGGIMRTRGAGRGRAMSRSLEYCTHCF